MACFLVYILFLIGMTQVNCRGTDDFGLDDSKLGNFTEFYNCFQRCADINSVDLKTLDDDFSDDRICTTLTTNKNVVNFMKCYINTCKLTIPTNMVNPSVPTRRVDDKNFNCPGFDPRIFTDDNPRINTPGTDSFETPNVKSFGLSKLNKNQGMPLFILFVYMLL